MYSSDFRFLGSKDFPGGALTVRRPVCIYGPADRFPAAARVPFLKPPHLLCTYTILNYKNKIKIVDGEVSKMKIVK